MAVAPDASSRAHADAVSQNQASFTWNHAGASSGVKGILVAVVQYDASADNGGAVTYDGTNVPAVTGGRAVDTANEPGSVKLHYLGSGVAQGTKAVVVNRTNNTVRMSAFAFTVLADFDTDITGIVLEQENQALTEENVDDGSPGTDSLRIAAIFSGLGVVGQLTIGSNSTHLQSNDPGNAVAVFARETTAGQGSRPVGYTAATDDVAAVYAAIREIVVAGATAYQIKRPKIKPLYLTRRWTQEFSVEAEAAPTAIGKEIALRWDDFAALGDPIALQWDIRAAVGDTSTLRWDIFTTVGDTVELQWDLRTAVGDTVGLLWDLRFALGDTVSIPWDVHANIGDQVGLLWDIYTPVGDAVSLLWDLMTSVGDQLSLLWDIRFALGDENILRWDIAAAVGDQMALLWDLMSVIGDSNNLQWDIFTVVNDQINFLWDLYTAVNDEVSFLWDQRFALGDTASLVWDIRTAVGDQIQLLWDILRDYVYLRPVSTVANDGWDTGPTPGGNLWENIDETSPDDDDYIWVTV